MADLLLYTGLTEEQQGLVETLRSSGQALLRVLNQILDLSKIESGRMELAEAPFSPRRLMADAAELIRPVALEHGLDLKLTIDWPAHLQAVADELRLRQIILNYLDNAIKHSPEGSHIRVVVREQAGSPVVDVIDNGPGIAAEHRDAIFQRFYRIDPARSRDAGGAGLGLCIAHWAVELHGGSIELESEEGKGSTFRIALAPLLRPGAPEVQPGALRP